MKGWICIAFFATSVVYFLSSWSFYDHVVISKPFKSESHNNKEEQ